MKILLIEDSNTQADIIQKLISRIDYKEEIFVEHVTDAFDGFLMLHAGDDYDVIVVDYEMPYSSGIQFTQKMRSIEDFKNLPILISSSHNNQKECLSKGASSHINKPYDGEMLIEAIENILK